MLAGGGAHDGVVFFESAQVGGGCEGLKEFAGIEIVVRVARLTAPEAAGDGFLRRRQTGDAQFPETIQRAFRDADAEIECARGVVERTVGSGGGGEEAGPLDYLLHGPKRLLNFTPIGDLAALELRGGEH